MMEPKEKLREDQWERSHRQIVPGIVFESA